MRAILISFVVLVLAAPAVADDKPPRLLESARLLAAEAQLERPEPQRQRPARPARMWLLGAGIIGGLIAVAILTGDDAPSMLRQGDPQPPSPPLGQ